jgi:hypothetical protein
MPGAVDRRRPAFAGLLAVAGALAWYSLVVHCVYGGNWTSLFCTGGNLVQPPALAGERIYRFAGSYGYDGQFYHYVAHDPFFRWDLARYIDAPRLRCRRILVPGLAYLAAAGQSGAIDAAFMAVDLLFLFAGVYWSSRYAIRHARHLAWGLAFLLTPAVLISLDRATVDLALVALCVAFALYVTEERSLGVYVVLMLAPLARETGLLLTAAYCVSLLLERRIRRAVFFATTAVPALAWFAFVQIHTSPYGAVGWLTAVPLAAVVQQALHPVAYPLLPAVRWVAQALDVLALAGILLAFVLSFWRPKGRIPQAVLLATAMMTLTGLNLGKPFWEDVFAFGRVFSPLLVLLMLESCAERSWLRALPVALIDFRIALPFGSMILKVARSLFA